MHQSDTQYAADRLAQLKSLFDIDIFKEELLPKEYLHIDLVKKHLALPLYKKKNALFIAITDPALEDLKDIHFLMGVAIDIHFIIVEANKLVKCFLFA